MDKWNVDRGCGDGMVAVAKAHQYHTFNHQILHCIHPQYIMSLHLSPPTTSYPLHPLPPLPPHSLLQIPPPYPLPYAPSPCNQLATEICYTNSLFLSGLTALTLTCLTLVLAHPRKGYCYLIENRIIFFYLVWQSWLKKKD